MRVSKYETNLVKHMDYRNNVLTTKPVPLFNNMSDFISFFLLLYEPIKHYKLFIPFCIMSWDLIILGSLTFRKLYGLRCLTKKKFARILVDSSISLKLKVHLKEKQPASVYFIFAQVLCVSFSKLIIYANAFYS